MLLTQIELQAKAQDLKNKFDDGQLSKEKFKQLIDDLMCQGAIADVYKTYCELNLLEIFF